MAFALSLSDAAYDSFGIFSISTLWWINIDILLRHFKRLRFISTFKKRKSLFELDWNEKIQVLRKSTSLISNTRRRIKKFLYDFKTKLDTFQGRRKVWKFEGACSTVVGIICPPGWDRVNCSAKHWGGWSPQSPPSPLWRPWITYAVFFQPSGQTL